MLVPFRSWYHNLNVCVSIHLYCYQHYHSHSMHCSNSHSTLTASCHTGLTCCSPAGILMTAVKRQTSVRMWYQWGYCQLSISRYEYIWNVYKILELDSESDHGYIEQPFYGGLCYLEVQYDNSDCQGWEKSTLGLAGLQPKTLGTQVSTLRILLPSILQKYNARTWAGWNWPRNVLNFEVLCKASHKETGSATVDSVHIQLSACFPF